MLGRLQDIKNGDVIKNVLAEGCIDRFPKVRDKFTPDCLLGQFIQLWDSTLTKENAESYCYMKNPWVWVIEFERCEKP